VSDKDSYKFQTAVPNTWEVALKSSLLGKSCVAPAKFITVGRLDSLTWVDLNNPLGDPVRKNTVLTFTIKFSPATVVTKELVLFSVEVVEGFSGVLKCVTSECFTEDVSAGGPSSRVFKVEIDNQTGQFQEIKARASLRGAVQKETSRISIGALF
jgi:hypothetical protein